MDVTATLSLGDPLEPARKATAQMLQERERTFSLPQPFYSDERLFDIDMQEIFQKEWLIAGMTCEIPTKGNYLTLQVGKNPIIVIRGADGVVHAFHNVCRHRGSRLCTSEKGKVAKLVCHYHQWTYELDGRLLFAGTEMGADFDMKQYGLKPVNVKTAGGYIFISLAENPPAIDDFLSTLSHYMEPYDMENTKVAIQTTLFEKANWKLVLENNRECYHCNASHPELLKTLLEWDDVTDPRAVQAALAEREIRHVLLEGGPTLATAFLRAGLVDQVVAYTAPALLGAGAAALADFGAATITDALRLSHPRVEVLGAGDELAVRFCGDLEADDVPPAHFHTEESH